VHGLLERKKGFFFEKKKQKTFALAPHRPGVIRSDNIARNK